MKNQATLKNTVLLKPHTCEEIGSSGLLPFDILRNDTECTFQPFDTAQGIFHDVLEHYFEFTDEHISKNSLEICGEVVASGMMFYYYHSMSLQSRDIDPNHFKSFYERICQTTFDQLENLIEYDNTIHGDRLNNPVPYQPYDLYHCEMLTYVWRGYRKNETLVKSDLVRFYDIAQLYKYGYEKAKDLVPENYNNMVVLNSFMEFLKAFEVDVIKNEDILNLIEWIEVKIWHKNDNISIEFILTGIEGGEDISIIIDDNYSSQKLANALCQLEDSIFEYEG